MSRNFNSIRAQCDTEQEKVEYGLLLYLQHTGLSFLSFFFFFIKCLVWKEDGI